MLVAVTMLVIWSVLRAKMGEKARVMKDADRAADRVVQKIKGL